MKRSVFDVEMNHIIADIEKRAAERYLSKHLTFPAYSKLKLSLLFLYLYSRSLPKQKIKTICTATALVQMGLDIHELVTNEQERTTKRIRTRQLQILAGDYFSSKYYDLLAKAGEVEAIYQLASGVNVTNQYKIILHESRDQIFDDHERWLQINQEMEGALIKGFIAKEETDWIDIVDSFILFELLIEGKTPKHWDLNFVQNLLDSYYTKISQLISRIPAGTIQEEFIQLINSLYPITSHSLVAEER